MTEEFPKPNLTPGKNLESDIKEGVNFHLEHNPELASVAYEALGFKGKDFVYTFELIDEIIEKPDFKDLLPIAQIFKKRDLVNHTKAFLTTTTNAKNFLGQNTMALGQSTIFIENNRIASNVSVFDKQHYEAINKPESVSQQSTLLHEEIHRYTAFIIREYRKVAKFPGIDYSQKFKEHFKSFGIDVSIEIEFLKEYSLLLEIYYHQKGWLNSEEFIAYGLTDKALIELLKEIRLHGNELSERMRSSLSGNEYITLHDALLNLFEYYYTNLSDKTYASTTDTLKLKFDKVLVLPAQKEQAEKIYLEYLSTLVDKKVVTKEGFINFIKTKTQKR